MNQSTGANEDTGLKSKPTKVYHFSPQKSITQTEEFDGWRQSPTRYIGNEQTQQNDNLK